MCNKKNNHYFNAYQVYDRNSYKHLKFLVKNNINVLNASEVYVKKWLKWSILY